MRRTLWSLTGALVTALAGIGSFNLALWVVDNEPPIVYEDARALTETVEQGGTIEVQFTVFRGRICPVVTKRWLYDAADARHSIPQFTTGLQLLAGRETYRRSITIPTAAAIGEARYEVMLDYTCNPLQKLIGPIKVTSPPVRFRITPAKTSSVGAPLGVDG